MKTIATRRNIRKSPSRALRERGNQDGLNRTDKDGNGPRNGTRTKRQNSDSNMEPCKECGKLFKKGRGLKIHLAKSSCLKTKVSHCNTIKSEAEVIRDSNHSDDSSHVGPREATNIMVNGKVKDNSSPLEHTKNEEKTADQEKFMQEEEMEIKVEGEVYRDVQKWIEETKESTTGEKGRRKKIRKEDGKVRQNKDIRNWLVAENNGQKTKDLNNVATAVEQSSSQGEKEYQNSVVGDTRTVEVRNCLYTEPKEREAKDSRTVIARSRQDGEHEYKVTEENRGNLSSFKGDTRNVDIRDWLKVDTKQGEKESGKGVEGRVQGCKGDEDRKREMERQRIRNLINEGSDEDVLARHGLHLKREDMKTLQGRNYLNDKIIDEYLRLVQQRNETHTDLPKVKACSTFLYTQLKTFGLEEGCRRTRRWIKEDLTKKDYILFPIHNNDHWSLVVVETGGRVVHYLDSINGSRYSSSAPGMIRRYMERLHRKGGEEVTYKVRIRKDSPLQENGVDCGVFVCKYAERMTRKAGMNFKQADIAHAREQMTEELLEGRIQREEGVSQSRQQEKREVKKKESKQKQQKASKVKAEKKEGADVKDRKERIDWPKANSQEWEKLDETLSEILKVQSSAPENKAVVHPTMIYALCRERFGVRGKKEKPTAKGPSKRQKKCSRLRKEINMLKEAYSDAKEEEKEAVKQLQEDKLRQLRLTKRAESLRKKRKAYARNCNAFLSQPFQFAKNQIDPKLNGELKSSKERVESFLQEVHGKPEETERTAPGDIPDYDEPEVEFDSSLPSWHEFNSKLKKARNNSAPGPNGVPYLLYKRCPKVARLLYGYLKGLWKKNTVSKVWRKAEGIFIPKEEGAQEVEKFRTISLLNVEGKLFFAMKAERLTQFIMSNKYIDESIQKGGVPGVSGCLEHTALLSQLIKEAKEGRKNLVVTWLDIANAYGSIPHSLIMTSLRKANVPKAECSLIESYYSDVQIRFTTKEFTTEWQRLEKGIVTGCTLSVILFSLAMTMLVASAKKETKGPRTESGQQQENARLFMDDITTTTETLVQTKHLLDNLARKLEWGGLEVRPGKCRSLVLIKGEISKKTPEINGHVISSIADKPVKYLGKIYNKRLNDREQTEETAKELRNNLKKLDRCQVPGKYKAWMLQHMVLPKLMWPLTIYQVPASKVSEMQRQITAKLKKWLGLPKSLSIECLYTTSGKLQLPFSELEEEMKAAKARLLTTLEEAEDPCVRKAGIQVDGGRKADTAQSIKQAKEKLKEEQIAGIPNRGREGLGLNPRKYFEASSKKERRKMVVEKVRETEEERRTVRMTGLAKQGGHLRWEVPARKVSPRDLVMMPEDRLKFLVKSVYDLLPTPQNKKTWFGEEEACRQCGETGTLTHILSGCRIALSEGKYKWRHDQVLKEIAQCVEERRRISNSDPREKRGGKMNFIRQGEKMKVAQQPLNSYFDGAGDWSMTVDLDGKLKVPERVAETNLRPDMILLSNSTRRMGIVELTVPSEERIEVSGELKQEKYAKIAAEGRGRGWAVRIWTVEVGCRGFPAASMATFLKDLGIGGGERRRALRRIGETAEGCSKSIWRWSCM